VSCHTTHYELLGRSCVSAEQLPPFSGWLNVKPRRIYSVTFFVKAWKTSSAFSALLLKGDPASVLAGPIAQAAGNMGPTELVFTARGGFGHVQFIPPPPITIYNCFGEYMDLVNLVKFSFEDGDIYCISRVIRSDKRQDARCNKQDFWWI